MATTVPARPLENIASDVNAAHEACESSYELALEHAFRAGHLLLEAKDQVGHGEWVPWLEHEFAGSVRTAQAYMRVAREIGNAQSSAHLSIDDALKAIAKPKADPPQSPQQVGDTLRDHGTSTAGALAALDQDDHEPAARFPAPGMQQRTWRQINQEMDACQRHMTSATDVESDWSRGEELNAAARRLRQGASMLDELAGTLR